MAMARLRMLLHELDRPRNLARSGPSSLKGVTDSWHEAQLLSKYYVAILPACMAGHMRRISTALLLRKTQAGYSISISSIRTPTFPYLTHSNRRIPGN